MSDKWEFYQTRNRLWRWIRYAGNAASNSIEAYHNLRDCKANAELSGYVEAVVTDWISESDG